MIVYRITKAEFANDLSGRGAFMYGGRWNSKGKYALYTSSHRSLAFLELMVHVPLDVIKISDYVMISIELPEIQNLSSLLSFEDSRLIGDSILRDMKELYFSVPSILFPEERNIIINPLHAGFNKLNILSTDSLKIDARLF